MRVGKARKLLLALMAVGLVTATRWDPIAPALETVRWLLSEDVTVAADGTPAEAGQPPPDKLDIRLAEKGLALGAPVFVRIFKAESALEIWMRRGQHYEHFVTYPVCRWSGGLGPKLHKGDKQAPEGVYTVAADQLNPNSRRHRSFNLGFPNALDRSFKRSGSFLMVHGGCSSIGCFAMTDPIMDDIWRLVSAALAGGQQQFQVHIYPFRMTDQNMRRRRDQPWFPFWQDLKHGHDVFEAEHVPPKVTLCNGHYAFQRASAPGESASGLEPGCPLQTAATLDRERH